VTGRVEESEVTYLAPDFQNFRLLKMKGMKFSS